MMIPRMDGDSVVLVTQDELEQDFKALAALIAKLNGTKDCAEKVAACMAAFGRRHYAVLFSLRAMDE